MTFNNYLYKVLIKPFIFSIFGCTFLLLVDFLSEIIQNVILKHIPVLNIMQLVSYNIVFLLNLSIPMGAMIGILLGYSSLSTSNEIIAFKSLGVSIRKIITPAFILGLISSIFLLMINQFLSYRAYDKTLNIIKEISYNNPSFSVESRSFMEGLKNYYIYINDYDDKKNFSKNFLIFQKNNNDKFNSIITGKYLNFFKGEISLEKAEVYEIDESGNNISKVLFDYRKIPLRDISPDFEGLGLGDKAEYYPLNILYKKMNLEANSKYYKLYFETIFYWKLALILSPIIFSILSSLLALGTNKRAGRGNNLVTGVILLLIYWVCIMYGRGIVDDKIFKPHIVMFFPNIIYIIISFILYLKRSRV